MSDNELLAAVQNGDYEKVATIARRTGKISLLKESSLTLMSREISYVYCLKFNKIHRFYGATAEELISQLSQAIDDSHDDINLVALGFYSIGGTYLFDEARGNIARNWRLSQVPTIQVGGSRVILSSSDLTPHFKIKGNSKTLPATMRLNNLCEKAGRASEEFIRVNTNAREAQREATRLQSDQHRAQRNTQLRQGRLTVFKEALEITKEAAIKYRDSIKDDPEFTRIAEILLSKKG